MAADSTPGTCSSGSDVLQRTLSSIWLRPERALLDAQLYEIAHSLLRKYHARPALDLATGEGTPTLLMQGGALNFLADEHSQHIRDQATWFPSFTDAVQRQVSFNPTKPLLFDIGTSWTTRQLAMAEQLQLHEYLVLSSRNVIPLDLSSKKWKFILSHNLFWADSERFFKLLDVQRDLLADDGRLLLLIPDKEGWLSAYTALKDEQCFTGERYGKLFSDAPFMNALRNALTSSELEVLWAQSEFECLDYARAGTFEALLFYGTGLRGVFPALSPLISDNDFWSSEQFASIKRSWIEATLHGLLGYQAASALGEGIRAWHLVILGRR